MGAFEPPVSYIVRPIKYKPPVTGCVFGQVEGQVERALIVASGPSVGNVDFGQLHRKLRPDVWVITVNQMIRQCMPHAWMTVDPNPKQRALMRMKRPGVQYFAAVPDDYASERPGIIWHKAPAEAGVTFLRRVTGPPSGPKVVLGLSEDAGCIHSGNSAWGALGVLYHKRPALPGMKIGLLGVDGTGRYGFGLGHPGNLSHLPELFASALPQLQAHGIEVINGSLNSRVTCFPRVDHREMLEWLQC